MAAVSSSSRGRAGRGVRGARAAICVLCLALLLLWLTRDDNWRTGGSASLSSRREFPHRAPADIAHRLADFSTLPHALTATPGSWRVEEDSGNFTTWRYIVNWECGPRCSGWTRVLADALTAEVGHAPALDHRVSLDVRTCTRAALLPWSADCDEMEITGEVESDGADGAVLRERARATCRRTVTAADCEATLREHRTRHHSILEGSI